MLVSGMVREINSTPELCDCALEFVAGRPSSPFVSLHEKRESILAIYRCPMCRTLYGSSPGGSK
eukprot:3346658-Prorocentrum_lima.AAC.1